VAGRWGRSSLLCPNFQVAEPRTQVA